MSGVDVVAVMDAEILAFTNTRAIVSVSVPERESAYTDHLAKLTEARAAIAELIEATTIVYEQVGGPDYDGSCSQAAFDRLGAALSAVTGGAK